MAAHAATTRAGAKVHPHRHPVIAYPLDADPQMTPTSGQVAETMPLKHAIIN